MKTENTPKYRKNVLIVDDDAEFIKIISHWMLFRGWEIATASDGAEAFGLMSAKKFGLILTDYNMPEMDGLALAEKIKNVCPVIPVILVTGIGSEIIEKEKRIGCIDHVLYKPFSFKELDRIINLCALEGDAGQKAKS